MKRAARVPGRLLFFFAALASPAIGQVPVMLPDFQVDTTGTGFSFGGTVAMDLHGQFVVTWTEGGVARGRRYDAQAQPVGGQFFVQGSAYASPPWVARDASGRFVYAWNDENQAIWVRRVAAEGVPLGDAFRVNAPGTSGSGPRVAADPSGNFVVTWTASTETEVFVMARRFDSAGAPLGDEFRPGEWAAGNQSAGGVAMSPAGFVVTWAGDGSSGTGGFARLFAPDGKPLTSDLTINTEPSHPDVAMDAGGDFVVVWTDTGEGASDSAAVGRRYQSTGVSDGDVFPISAPSSGALAPQVASDSEGNFVVSWHTYGSVYARHYDTSGTPAAPAFQVYQGTMGTYFPRPAVGDDGSFVVDWTDGYGGPYGSFFSVRARKSGMRATHWIDLAPGGGVASGPVADSGNGILEPGETMDVHTAWINDTAAAVELAGTSPFFTGPAGADYTLNDGSAYYGFIPPGYSTTCLNGADCYSVTVSDPAVRPVRHWDARLQENLSIGVPKTWMLHVGESFADVPTGNMFYASIETLFHNGVTGGCGGGGYCPSNPVTRAQMAVFLLRSKFGAAHVPPPCTGAVFSDVDCTGSPYDPWIEELAALGVTSGCGGDLYCPGDAVTREQMAVFLLKTRFGSAYTPPACTQQFEDVPCGGEFAPFINDLYARGITGGCSAVPALYCPGNANNRGQMAVFLVKTFGLVLYRG
jgi:hypothetical protein